MRSVKLHAISTGRQSVDELVGIASRIHRYVDAIHIREKHRSAKEVYEIIVKMVEGGVPIWKIIVNDRVDVAVCAGVQGVQLAYHSLDVGMVRHSFPNLIIGRSVHSEEEATVAEQDGADYLIYGHIYTTGSKAGLMPHGLTALRTICKTRTLQVIAIGGIKPDNVQQVMEAGAAGIAVMTGIFEASDPIHAVQDYHSKIHR